jgi:chromate transporter
MGVGKPSPALLRQLFTTFLKIGPVTFGGGYAMIPLIEKEVVERRRWIETKHIADIFAVAESVPGAIAVNSAAFVGYHVAGVAGAIAAVTGILLPTFCIVVLLSLFILQVRDNPVIEAAFTSIRATIVALITYAAYKIGKTAVVDKTTAAVVAATVLIMLFTPVHPVVLIIGGALAGIAIVRFRQALGIATRLDDAKPSSDTYWDPEYFMGDGI